MTPDLTNIWAAFRAGDAALAVTRAEALVAMFPRHGEVWHALACARERAGDLRGADNAFLKASRAAEEPVGLPWRVPWASFRAAVAGAAQELPERLRLALGEVTLVLEDYVDPQDAGDLEDAELLGLFTGPIRAERDQFPEVSPAIHLYRRAHEHATGSRNEFIQEVRRTLYHEFGHYLGYGEEGLTSLGLD